MIKHTLLKRQLKHSALSETEFPRSLEQWQIFLSHIDQTYLEGDQFHYTIERAQDISSKEMQELYESLEEAQQMSRLGSWIYNVRKGYVWWSSEAYRLCKRDPALGLLTYDSYFSYVHPEDRFLVEKTFKNTLHTGEDSEIEYRIVLEGEIRWMRSKTKIFMNKETGEPETMKGTILDITDQKNSELNLIQLQDQLITAARRSGMAEIATSVLHNVGNVLNSLNVSSEILLEKINTTKISNLQKISNLINSNRADLGNFIVNDPKGKLIPDYLENMALQWEEEKKDFIQNLVSMNSHIEHIKDIVQKQKGISGSIGIIQPVVLENMLNDALTIVNPEQIKGDIEILKEIENSGDIFLDKVSLLQILVNLIRNAKESLESSTVANKKLQIKLAFKTPKIVTITIEDNGSGISSEDLSKIFTYGFTTKKKGSGVGLHTSILAAREMGGDLKVYSEGIGKGAKFILTLPNKINTNIK